MKNELDINNLDELLFMGHSFKGKYILEWCKSNLNNEDFNISYAANEIYNTYLNNSERPLNLNNFYYIVYCNAFLRNRLYSISRDTILSPKYDSTKQPVHIKNIEKGINSIIIHKKLIISNGDKYDKPLLDKGMKLLYYRLNLLGIKNIKDLTKSFNKFNAYKKYQVYSVIKDCASYLKMIYIALKEDTD